MIDMKEVRGMPEVVAAVEKAITAKRHLLLCGPPGISKTMVARRIPMIMPLLTAAEREALAVIYARADLAPAGDDDWVPTRPFRAPHHSISSAALAGNRTYPGELKLATYGVLFLDEIHEFQRATIKRLGSTLRQDPHPVLIVATTNPCPCGWNGYSDIHWCHCKPEVTFRFRLRTQKLCQELGIEDFVDVPSLSLKDIAALPPGENSETIRKRITMQIGKTR